MRSESELVARGELAKSSSKREVGGRKAGDDWMEPQELEEAQGRGAGNLTVGISGVGFSAQRSVANCAKNPRRCPTRSPMHWID